ncbi:MAG TPA: glycosyltransferase family 87 protein [Candidatus Limnocylindrales bacterium]
MDRWVSSSRLRIAGLLVAPLGIVLVVVVLTPGPAFAGVTGDVGVFFGYANRLLGGAIPYRGFPLEYPPLALVPMSIPRLVWPFGTPTDDAFSLLFALMEGCLAVLVGSLIARASADPMRALATWAVLVLAAGASITWRYDLWPAALVLGAVVAVDRGRPGLAGVAIGVGTMLKLFPIVVLPILAARSLALRDWAGLKRLVLGAAVTVALVMGVAFAAAGSDSLMWLTYELDRGLQLESTGSGILLLLHVLADQPFALVHAFGTLEVVAPGADIVAPATTVIELLLVAAVGACALVRFRRDARRLGAVPLASLAVAVVAVVVALIVSSKVFSAQYIVWFLPLIPFVPGRLRWMGLVIAAVSTVIYPLAYTPVWQLDPLMALVLNARNVLLILFLLWLGAWLLAREGPAART